MTFNTTLHNYNSNDNYCRTPQIKFFIQPLDFHICSPSENMYCDSFRLWQSLPFHPPQHGPKVCLQLLILPHRHNCWLLLYFSYCFGKGHTEILSQRFLKILLVDVNGQKIVTWICVTWNIWSLRLIYFRLPIICSVYHQNLVDDCTYVENIF